MDTVHEHHIFGGHHSHTYRQCLLGHVPSHAYNLTEYYYAAKGCQQVHTYVLQLSSWAGCRWYRGKHIPSSYLLFHGYKVTLWWNLLYNWWGNCEKIQGLNGAFLRLENRYCMAGNFLGVLIVMKSQKALRINFHGFNFRDSNLVQEYGTAHTMMYMYSIHMLNFALSFLCHCIET